MKIEDIEVTEATIGRKIELTHTELLILKNELNIAQIERNEINKELVSTDNLFSFIDKICQGTADFEKSREDFFAKENADDIPFYKKKTKIHRDRSVDFD